MNDNLKRKILGSLNDISKEEKNDLGNMVDILNLLKIVGNYEELEPEIKEMLNKKAYRDKWEKEEK